jgi:CheY-like chemotaxis protein
MQGGSIGVGSNKTAGSIFSFYIKSRKATAPRDAHIDIPTDINPQDIARRPKSPEATDPSQFHILVVEDNLINQRVLSTQLQKLGCTIQVAGHGIEALEALKQTTLWKEPTVATPAKLSVILMDIEMPVMDGLSCARRIRELEDGGEILKHVPIIAVSANARREQVEEAIGAGMDDAISKPFRIAELMPKIRKLVDKE